MPFAQDAVSATLASRSGAAARLSATTAAVQRVLAEIDPEMQAYDVFTMSERVDKSLNPRRAPMVLSLAFGLVALLLASVGLYGVLAYQVNQRTREIGIRMALGSDTLGILRLVCREGALLVAHRAWPVAWSARSCCAASSRRSSMASAPSIRRSWSRPSACSG